ncbi:Diadenosine tetraphosphate (Ap4A) hydrolase [Cohaesibacter marisflavi]|uniref:Diadenosine tetraphosphate (Ap4A) hydrolase n=1 Tax=Cohaesibacter marisflavi TaxID=655353 RepID=A0A1I5D389_9HYPH|nr:HIT family protein [Cohaesibacter marisflavi]SFN93321.1 Diadenosine tetraphosphate (Ap4A) hydrolase [Cohaesibacter marisflavi]
MVEFTLDPQLKADSLPLAELKLCTVRLMNDSNFPWLVMIPQIAGAEELIDLTPKDQHRLTDEIARVSKVLQAETGCDKLNVASLGNQVRQLHIHVIARFEGDAAWAGPIWGKMPARPYEKASACTLIERIAAALL